MKKIICGLVVLMVLVSGFFYEKIVEKVDYFIKKEQMQTVSNLIGSEEFQKLFKTERNIPKTADLGSFLAAHIARDEGDFVKSVPYLKKAYIADKEQKDVRKQLYFLAGITGDIPTLMSMLQDAKKEKKEFFFSSYLIVAELIKNEKYEEARKFLLSQKNKKRESFEYPLLAWVYAGLKNKELALKSLEGMEKDAFLENLKWYHSAMILDYLGYFDEAEVFYKKLSKKTKFSSLSVLVSGKKFYQRQKKWSFSNEFYITYETLLKEQPLLFDILKQVDMPEFKTPSDGVAELFYSWATNTANHQELSILISNIALYLNNEHTLAQIWSAELFEKMKYYDLAHAIYDDLLKRSENADIILYKKGLLYAQEEKFDLVVEIFSDLIKRNEYNPLVISTLALAHQSLREYDKAAPLFEKSLFLLEKMGVSNAKDVHFQAAVSYLNMGEFAKFEKHIYRCLQLDEKDAHIMNYLAYSWLERDLNIEEAVAFLETAHELEPDSPEIMDSLAFGYYKQGKYQKALVLSEKAVDLLGASSVANMHLGDIYKVLGRHREAKSQYEKALALKLDLTPEVEKELLKRLK